MKLSDDLIELFDTLSTDNQNYALAVLQSLCFAQDTMNKQLQVTDKGKKATVEKKDGDKPTT